MAATRSQTNSQNLSISPSIFFFQFQNAGLVADETVVVGLFRNSLSSLSVLVGFVYPAYASFKALKSSDVRIRLRALEQLFLNNEPAAKIFNILSAQWYDRAEIVARYDLAVKSGKCEYEEVLLDMVLS